MKRSRPKPIETEKAANKCVERAEWKWFDAERYRPVLLRSERYTIHLVNEKNGIDDFRPSGRVSIR